MTLSERGIAMSIKAKFACLFLTCLLSLALGCVEIATLYHGKTVSSVPVVALQEGSPVAGRWETFDLIIDYKYMQNGARLELSGQAALSQHYQRMYTNISRMYTYLFFLDKDSLVLETASFINVWTSYTRDIQNFSKSYKIPTRTTGISFGYSGQTQGMDSKTSFYELPLSKK
jgi:hypothetical protein